MRIVYDDEQQKSAIFALDEFMTGINFKKCCEYSNGMDRISSSDVKKYLDSRFREFQMEIGKTVTHAYGIGNNCKYPIYYYPMDKDEAQICVYININHGMFGECYVSLEDYNNNKIGDCMYEITKHYVRRLYRG